MKRKRRKDSDWELWAAAGVVVLAFGGVELFVAWLLPGVPPPGPLG